MSRPLRIFLCCQQSDRRHAVPAYAFWAGYFRDALAEAGHVCLEAPDCDWAAGLRPEEQLTAENWADRTWAAALDFLRREQARQPVDFFLGYLFPRQVSRPALSAIRALGIPCVNFFCDNVREFRRIPAAYHGFDLHWVPEHKALPVYARDRLPVLHAPMACWIPPAQRTPVPHETRPVTFVGTRDEQRERLFADALRLGWSGDLCGPGWESAATAPAAPPPRARDPLVLLRRQIDFARQHGVPALARKYARALRPPAAISDAVFAPHARPAQFGEAYWPALREATVCIGVNRYPSLRFPFDRPDTYSRLRDLEAPMCGACYLTEWTEGLDELYDLGTEIETYRTAAELVEKSRALSADAPRRQRMRVAAQRRALADHSITRTLAAIASRLGCDR
ncbi:MAG: glycosyltransferase [Verrucomicrobia bacterium]|nr:glycosyltransferase [Verrucomicrobiota bacterium]